MSKKGIILIFLIFALVLYYSFNSIELPAAVYPVVDNSNKPIGEITKSVKVGQTFQSERSNLNRIDLLLATYGRSNSEDIIFHLSEISDLETSKVEYIFNANSVRNNQYFSIAFPEIQDSEGKYYYFYLESPNSKANNAITIWYLPNNSYPAGNLFINGNVAEGDLLFRPYFKSNIIEYSDLLLDRMQTNKPWFYNKIAFIILFFMFFLSFSLAAIWFLEKNQVHE